MAILSSNPGGSQVYTINVKYDFAIARYFMESKIALIFPIFDDRLTDESIMYQCWEKGGRGKKGVAKFEIEHNSANNDVCKA